MPKNSEGRNQIEDLQEAFTKAALDQEFATERYIKIPQKVRELYMQMGRPTPLFRAKRLEKKSSTLQLKFITKGKILLLRDHIN